MLFYVNLSGPEKLVVRKRWSLIPAIRWRRFTVLMHCSIDYSALHNLLKRSEQLERRIACSALKYRDDLISCRGTKKQIAVIVIGRFMAARISSCVPQSSAHIPQNNLLNLAKCSIVVFSILRVSMNLEAILLLNNL